MDDRSRAGLAQDLCQGLGRPLPDAVNPAGDPALCLSFDPLTDEQPEFYLPRWLPMAPGAYGLRQPPPTGREVAGQALHPDPLGF